MMFARTKRLTLRPGWPEDAPALHAAIAHEDVAMKLARLPWPYRLADAAAFLALPRGATDASFLIFDHAHGCPRLVGGVGLMPGPDTYELGYWLTPAAWGRGYATEAARAVIEMARHALPVSRLRAHHQLDNAGSARVLAKLGFRQIGTESRASLARGRMIECATCELDLTEGGDPEMQIAA
ncbi:MAG: GNAT family N-acetyltransferase [Pseudomonadota bacterium]|nr:GNAT family N-acetyltransferase [Pseudomonadota bacterium]